MARNALNLQHKLHGLCMHGIAALKELADISTKSMLDIYISSNDGIRPLAVEDGEIVWGLSFFF